jgi:hypothetical protein
VICFRERAKDLIRQPVQEGLDSRVGELPVGIANAGEPSSALTVHEWLTLGELDELNDAA